MSVQKSDGADGPKGHAGASGREEGRFATFRLLSAFIALKYYEVFILFLFSNTIILHWYFVCSPDGSHFYF